jgi:hypothetical protein
MALASQLLLEHFAEQSAVPFATSNNIGATARLLRDIPFDERYSDAGGEDRDWCQRLAARGYRIAHDPGAMVVHHQPLTIRRYVSQHAPTAAAHTTITAARTDGAVSNGASSMPVSSVAGSGLGSPSGSWSRPPKASRL